MCTCGLQFLHDEYRVRAGELEWWLVSPSERLVRVELLHPNNIDRRLLLEQLVSGIPFAQWSLQSPSVYSAPLNPLTLAQLRLQSSVQSSFSPGHQRMCVDGFETSPVAALPSFSSPDAAAELAATTVAFSTSGLAAAAPIPVRPVLTVHADSAGGGGADSLPQPHSISSQAEGIRPTSSSMSEGMSRPLPVVSSPRLQPRTPPLVAPSPFMLMGGEATREERLHRDRGLSDVVEGVGGREAVVTVTTTETVQRTTRTTTLTTTQRFSPSQRPSPDLFPRRLQRPAEISAHGGKMDACTFQGPSSSSLDSVVLNSDSSPPSAQLREETALASAVPPEGDPLYSAEAAGDGASVLSAVLARSPDRELYGSAAHGLRAFCAVSPFGLGGAAVDWHRRLWTLHRLPQWSSSPRGPAR